MAGDVLAYNYTRFFGGTLPFPSVADVFYLATGPLLIAGLLSLVRRRNPAHDRGTLIDVLIVTTSAGTMSWTFLIAPYAHDTTLSLGTKEPGRNNRVGLGRFLVVGVKFVGGGR